MSDAALTVLIGYQAREGMSDTARGALAELVSTVLDQESDCHSIELHQEMDDPDSLFNIERRMV